MMEGVTSPYQRRLLTLQLESLALYLRSADHARRETTAARKEYWTKTDLRRKLSDTDTVDKQCSEIRQHDIEYRERLTAVLIISRLCCSQGYQHPHRIERLLSSLASCRDAASRYFRALKADLLVAFDPANWGEDASEESVEFSLRQLELAADSIELIWRGEPVKPRTIEPASMTAYFDRTPYERCKLAETLSHTSGKMLIEPYKTPFKTIVIGKVPRWNAAFMGPEKQRIDFAVVNALWHSLTVARLFKRKSRPDYFALYKLMLAASGVLQGQPSNKPDLSWSPQELTDVLSGMRVDLGLIFADDPAVVVWPAGKSHAKSGRSIVLYCPYPQHCDPKGASPYWWYRQGSLYWRYKPLSDTTADDSRTEANATATPIVRVGKKTFLDLPAELRNVVYTMYLNDSADAGAGERVIEHFKLKLPDICMASKQICDEVAPQWLASTRFRVGPKLQGLLRSSRSIRSSMLLARDILKPSNYFLSQLPNASHIRHLKILQNLTPDIIITLTDDARADDMVVRVSGGQQEMHSSLRNGLRDLAESLAADNGTGGLSLTDVVAIVDYQYTNQCGG